MGICGFREQQIKSFCDAPVTNIQSLIPKTILKIDTIFPILQNRNRDLEKIKYIKILLLYKKQKNDSNPLLESQVRILHITYETSPLLLALIYAYPKNCILSLLMYQFSPKISFLNMIFLLKINYMLTFSIILVRNMNKLLRNLYQTHVYTHVEK